MPPAPPPPAPECTLYLLRPHPKFGDTFLPRLHVSRATACHELYELAATSVPSGRRFFLETAPARLLIRNDGTPIQSYGLTDGAGVAISFTPPAATSGVGPAVASAAGTSPFPYVVIGFVIGFLSGFFIGFLIGLAAEICPIAVHDFGLDRGSAAPASAGSCSAWAYLVGHRFLFELILLCPRRISA